MKDVLVESRAVMALSILGTIKCYQMKVCYIREGLWRAMVVNKIKEPIIIIQTSNRIRSKNGASLSCLP